MFCIWEHKKHALVISSLSLSGDHFLKFLFFVCVFRVSTQILHMAWSTTAVNEFCGVGDNTVAFYSQVNAYVSIAIAMLTPKKENSLYRIEAEQCQCSTNRRLTHPVLSACYSINPLFFLSFSAGQPASGKALKVTAGNFGAAAKQLFTCVAYTKKGTCIVGAKDGSVYAFGDQTCKKVFPGVHQSVVRVLFCLL